MSQVTANPPVRTVAPAVSATTNPFGFAFKLLVLAVVALPAIYAIGFAITNESFGVAIAIIPDMLAAIAAAWGILYCVMFLDAEEHN
jgi:hypothetical protein